MISVEESNTFGVDLEFTEGMQFDKGFLSPYFVTDPDRQEAVLDEPYILFVNGKITAVQELVPVLEKVMQGGKPLLIIAEDVEGEALATLVVNKIRGTFTSVGVKAPGFGERRKAMLQDLAILSGGQVISEEVGLKLENTSIDLLGQARKVIITKDETTIVEGAGDGSDVEGRVAQIKREIDETDSDWMRKTSRTSSETCWRRSRYSSWRSNRSGTERKSTASKMQFRPLAQPSKRASSLVAAQPYCVREQRSAACH